MRRNQHHATKPTAEAEEPISPELAADQAEGNLEAKAAELQEAVRKALEERDQLSDQLLRTMAEFQNFRNRTRHEAEALRAFATERLVQRLLPVLDNFERTIAAAEGGASLETLIEGVKAVDRQLRTALEAEGVRRISGAGAAFDPEHHEAIATETSEEHPDETILAEIEPGYKMGEKVIRPARVKVARRG